ncbi:MAG: endonuclease/exonuclease/phosphatase, partial [Lysinibacillus sp.]
AYVIAYSQANQALLDKANITSNIANFNGDDALVLKKDTEVIDSIGQVGSTDFFGKDVTLIRKSHILTGDIIIDDKFTASNEWVSKKADSFDNLGTHKLTNEEDTGEPPVDPTLETVSIADARTKATDTLVQTKGIVTAVLKNTVQIQDEHAAIALHPKSKLSTVNVGDEIVVKGNIGEFNNLLQMKNIEMVETVGQKEVPAPLVVTGAEVNLEENESKLVTAKNITLNSESAGNYIAEDALGTQFTVRDENNSLGLEVGKTYEMITGIIQQFNDT